MSFNLKIKLQIAELLAKIWVKFFGLKVNCLLTRLPLVWLDPDFTDCINLCLLREHGYHVGIEESSPFKTPTTSPHHTLHKPTKKFQDLLRNVISLAEKDLLEF